MMCGQPRCTIIYYTLPNNSYNMPPQISSQLPNILPSSICPIHTSTIHPTSTTTTHHHHRVAVASLSLSFVSFVRQPPMRPANVPTNHTNRHSFRERSVNSISSITSIHSLRTIRRPWPHTSAIRHRWNHRRRRRQHLQPFRPVRRHPNRSACSRSTPVWQPLRQQAPVCHSSGRTCRSRRPSTIGR